jgi:hypothetical protein
VGILVRKDVWHLATLVSDGFAAEVSQQGLQAIKKAFDFLRPKRSERRERESVKEGEREREREGEV